MKNSPAFCADRQTIFCGRKQGRFTSARIQCCCFHRLGAAIFPITAEHGTGVDDLLDAAIAQVCGASPLLAESGPSATGDDESRPVEIAIIGRPNVGKSTLLNRMVGEERSIVSPVPGTTMDTVDTEVTRDGRVYRFVDTAGIRRKGKTNLVAEKLSVVMARRGLERADVALLVVDSEQGVTQGDAQIASYAEESGRSVVIVMNKWDPRRRSCAPGCRARCRHHEGESEARPARKT